MTGETLKVALKVCSALDRLGVTYALVGSAASSLHGEPRGSLDVDLLVDLAPDLARDFKEALGSEFNVDLIGLQQALRQGESFAIFHVPLVFKVDLFPAAGSALNRSVLTRAQVVDLPAEGASVRVQSAEDVILSKLRWYPSGGGVCEQQWRDVVGVLKVHQDRLDWGYLGGWAGRPGLSEHLSRARSEVSAGE
jgi:hypothetical protein